MPALISIFGQNLGRAPTAASQLPLPRRLGDVSVKLGEIELPLLFVGPGQVSAQVPVELPPGATASLVIQTGNLFTTPDQVTIVPVQPAIFTMNQQGTGQGAILNQDASLNSATNPAARGSVIQIFATGLGATNPLVPSGTPAPSSPLARVINELTATVGGLSVPAQFAGLAPGYVGLYRVDVVIPPAAGPGSAVELTLLQNDVPSNTVTVAIE